MKRAPIFLLCYLMAVGPAFAVPGSPMSGGGGGAATTSASDLTSGTLPAARIADNSVTNAKLVDNTVADAKIASDAAIDATKLGGGLVSNTELSYVDNVTSAIQTQLDGKVPSAGSASIATVGTITSGTWNGTDVAVTAGGTGASTAADARTNLGLGSADNVTHNTVTAASFLSSAIDGAHEGNVSNSGAATGLTTAGDMAYNLTTSKLNIYDNTIADNVAIATAYHQKCTTIDNTVAASDYPMEQWKYYAVTIRAIRVYQVGADNVIGGVDECTGANGTCGSVTAVDADITGTNGNEVADDGSLTNPSIAAGNRIFWHTTSVGGTNTYTQICVDYTIDD